MPWLAEAEVQAARRLVRALAEASSEAELRGRALPMLGELVPADLLAWDRVDRATGAVLHECAPTDAETPGAFASHVARAADHPLLAAHARRRRGALRLSEALEPRRLRRSELYGDVLHPAGVEYEMAIGMHPQRGAAVVASLGRTEREFSEHDRDVLDVVRPGLETALDAARAHERLVRALASNPPPGLAVMLLNRWGEVEHSSIDAERWLSEHFGPAEHPGWPSPAVADWLALPPRPPLISTRGGRRLIVSLLPGEPHALLIEEQVASMRSDALRRLGLTHRECEVLRASQAIEDEREIARELFLSPHAVREQLERIESKLDVHTAHDAVGRALRESC
jgi:DNA-binding CsgD family transcriptional regulator